MNVQEYIDSGILELYCLGELPRAEACNVREMMVYQAVSDEIDRIKATLGPAPAAIATAPPAHLQDEIWGILQNLEKEKKMDIADLPLINKFSDHNKWLSLVPYPIPVDIDQEPYTELLTGTPGVTQLLVISKTDFEDEVHTDLKESFLILEGHCACTVDGQVRQMAAGDFMAIPLHAHHNVKITSPYVVAILQHIAA